MSIKTKLNDYLLRNVSKSKVNYLFAVSEKHLFNKIHELNEQVAYLSNANDFLSDKVDILKTEITGLKHNNNKTQSKSHIDIKTDLAYKGLLNEYEVLKNENKSIKATVDVVSRVVENTKKQNEQLKERLKRVEHENERLKLDTATITKENIQNFSFFETFKDLNLSDGSKIRKGTEFLIEGYKDNGEYHIHFCADERNHYVKEFGDGYIFTLQKIQECAKPIAKKESRIKVIRHNFTKKANTNNSKNMSMTR